MAETLSLMEFLQALLADAGLRSEFGDDPQGTLADHGLADLAPADVHDALVLVQDNLTVDYSLDAAAIAPPPPPPVADEHGAAVEYLARYLADPHQTDPHQVAMDEQWADPDEALTPVATPGDAPFGPFAAGDSGYGSGSGTPGDDGSWARSDELDSQHDDFETAEFNASQFDTAGFDAAEFGTAEFGTAGFDLPDDASGEDLSGDDRDWPDPGDTGTALPAGA